MAAKRYDMGTPIGGERKQARHDSPLDQMDGDLADGAEKSPKSPIRQPDFSQAAEGIDLTPDESDMKSMMTKMMGMMTKMTTDMSAVRVGVEEAKTKAQQAVDIAKKTDAKVVEVKEKMVTKGTVQSMIDASIPKIQKSTMTKDDVQKMIDETLSQCSTPRTARSTGATSTLTAVIGSVPNADSFEKAVKWATDFCHDQGLPTPDAQDMYCKGDFKGIFFIKFANDAGRQAFLEAVEKYAKAHKDQKTAWAKPDLPIQARVQQSVLFQIRRMLVQWGYNKTCIKVDTDDARSTLQGPRWRPRR